MYRNHAEKTTLDIALEINHEKGHVEIVMWLEKSPISMAVEAPLHLHGKFGK